MAMFHDQSTPGINVALDEANLTFVTEPDGAPDVRREPQTASEHASSLPPFRSRVVRVPKRALLARVAQA
jgi:hypothetical protein